MTAAALKEPFPVKKAKHKPRVIAPARGPGYEGTRALVEIAIDEIEERALRGLRTMRALPDKEASYLKSKGYWPETIQLARDAYGALPAVYKFRPTPADVSDCLEALSWLAVLDENEKRLVWWRSFDLSFRHIAARIGRSDETARRRYTDALVKVWAYANGYVEVERDVYRRAAGVRTLAQGRR